MRSKTKHENGVALIITLSLLVVATILVTGFLVSMRTERQAAQSMANSQLTDVIAQDAVQHATALLDNNIPQPVPPGQTPKPQNWIVSPGLLTKIAGVDGTTPQYIPLSTNTDYLNPPPTANSVDLNAAIPGSSPASNYMDAVGSTVGPMLTTWVNVLQNPLAPASATNPVVGRYAFWIDDENAKINVNTAYGKPTTLRMSRTNPLDTAAVDSPYDDVGFDALRLASSTTPTGFADHYPNDGTYQINGTEANAVGTSYLSGNTEMQARLYPLWHPSAINLDILGLTSTTLNRAALADWVWNGTYNSTMKCVPYYGPNGSNYRPLAYPEQIMQFVTADGTGAPTDPQFFNRNKFNLTAYNRAPEFNVFGKPRLLLEKRIRTKTALDQYNQPQQNDSTAGSVHYSDTYSSSPFFYLGNYVSGGELEFYQTPDLDPYGPTYFHGADNTIYGTAPASTWADASSVQMVADYISTLLNRSDWPGMPARSFVQKWGGDAAANREADQVAWNIAAMGNYAVNLEGGTNLADWPDCQNMPYLSNTNGGTADSNGNNSPSTSSVSVQAKSAAGADLDPNKCLRLGKLSQKAIMPFAPKPYLNEASILITPYPKSATDSSQGYYVGIQIKLELYAGKRCPPGTFWGHYGLDFGLTHFIYTVSDTQNDVCTQAASGATGDGDGGVADVAAHAYPAPATYNPTTNASDKGRAAIINCLGNSALPTNADYPEPADGMITVLSTGPVWASSGASFLAGTTPPSGAVAFKGIVHFRALARIALYYGSGHLERTWEIIPVWDTVGSSQSAMKPPAGQEDSLSWDFSVDLREAGSSTTFQFSRSLEVADARTGGMTNDKFGTALWQPLPGSTTDTTTEALDTLGEENYATSHANVDLDDYSYLDFQNAFYRNSPRPSIGFLSCIPTGMQRGLPSQTFQFLPSTSKMDVPDWLILDLVAPAFADTSQPAPAPLSYRHSTMGKLNLNAQLYPTTAGSLQRTLPMQALFKNVVSDAALAQLVNNVMEHNLSGLPYGALDATPKQYDYIGELCEVTGVADGTIPLTGVSTSTGTAWQKEAIIRNLANILTVQSNTFKIYGLAQAIQIKKKAGNTNYGAVEAGDTVAVNGEKRFESVIERAIWPGADGVPGNAHIMGGVYDLNSQSTSQPVPPVLPWAAIDIPSTTIVNGAKWAAFDGPEDPTTMRAAAGYAPVPGWAGLIYSSSTLKTALNPARAHMTYKPISFRYVTN